MKSISCWVLMLLGSTALCGLSEQPDGPPPKKGPRPQPGSVLPPFVRAELELSEEQERQIADLEREVKGRLAKILSEEQMRQVEEGFRKGPPPPPPPPQGRPRERDGDRSPPKGRPGERDGDRPPPPPDSPPRKRREPPPRDEKGEPRPQAPRTNPW